MPVQYKDLGLGESHLWTREKASLFDVSHMVQHYLKGPGAEGLLSRLTPAGLSSLQNHHSTLSCLLHPNTGGIVDDCIITRMGPDSFYTVTNAACREKDSAYLATSIEQWKAEGGEAVEWELLDGQGLIALQGPLAPKLLEPLVIDMKEDRLQDFYFGQSKFMKLRLPSGKESSPLLVSRGGYTGEDGFEISVPAAETEPLVDFLLTVSGSDQLRLAGLGARDSLRLEAGMCLYGHDLTDDTTPVEGGLSWIVAKDRRAKGGFNGDEVILQQLKSKKDGGTGVQRRRIGLTVEGAPAREGARIVDASGDEIGNVTSGCPSPTMKQNIAMGYIKTGHHKSGTEVFVMVRGKQRRATVSKMPFLPSKYFKAAISPG
ncbi:MAG: Aminomethyltransferase, mitochondrial [Chrysothrix sp. TS-e1954]|nr:MAG: Aminomethyltransferase, mitochondrial [Chrysothrix sp. TS-e1954]